MKSIFLLLVVSLIAIVCGQNCGCGGDEPCCSQYGYCGSTAAYCDKGSGCKEGCWGDGGDDGGDHGGDDNGNKDGLFHHNIMFRYKKESHRNRSTL